jgi:acyl transferase domain-containing protein/enoyl-CoA hydratase/carnithine racemase/acyl carrier protein
LSEARIDARQVSYIEAHGTGTKLGDPIEIAALSKAFQQHTSETGFCAIGSAKSNIGHCESAAGIAGLTKVLLQMQHRQLAPSLHAQKLNPHIDFEKTPFVVNQSLRPWDAPVVEGRTLPRIAGISSFGAGGSNAHLVVEEYIAPVEARTHTNTIVIIPLSARTAEQLKQRVRDLLEFIRARGAEQIDLAAMAYTLQVGREAMDERFGLLVSSVEQLAQRLQAFLAGAQDIEDACQGQVKQNKETLSLFATDLDLQQTIEKWIAQKQLAKLLELWVKGLEVQWSRLYGEAKPARISLPTYPFAKERYWVELHARAEIVKESASAVLHPLVHTNTSDLYQQSYCSTFSEQLPAVAYLEMARAAVELATPERAKASVLELRNIVWAQPLAVKQPAQIHIALLANDDEQIDFEIYSQDGQGEIIHCQGHAVISKRPAPAKLNVSPQTFVEVRATGTDKHRDGYVLHPSVMHGALQAALGSTGTANLSAVESVRVFASCNRDMLAWVRVSAGHTLDIDLCDHEGNVCAELRGISYLSAPPQQLADIPVSLKKPSGIALAAPGALNFDAEAPARRPGVRISSVEDAPSSVSMQDKGNGIFSIQIATPADGNTLSDGVIERLLSALDQVRQAPGVKALIISGTESCFLRGGRAQYNAAVERKLYRALAAFPYPTIAAMQGDAAGAGFLVGALCDFMICSEEASYGYTQAQADFYPTGDAALFFAARFGAAAAQDFLYIAELATGKALQAKGWTCPILPRSQVGAHARKLAADLAGKPQEALRLLKQHLVRHQLRHVDALNALSTQAAAPPPRREVISSGRHIHLETHSEVLVVRLGAEGMLTDLTAVFAQLHESGAYQAVVLASEHANFLPHADDSQVLELQRRLSELPVPVIAALSSNAQDGAWLLSQCCDAVIHSRDGLYSFDVAGQSTTLTQAAAAVFAVRYGDRTSKDILLASQECSGAELQLRAGTTTVVEPGQVLPVALQLAAQWARLPGGVWMSWKKHLASAIQNSFRDVPASESVPNSPASDAAITVALDSKVITATAHPEGILIVRMEDRQAKNMFSAELVAGIQEVFSHIEKTPAYKAVVLIGYDNYFASGGTRETLLAIQEGKMKFTDARIFHLAMECKVPVIAAMQGHGIGAGWSLGMFADFILFSEESKYLSPYMEYGFTPGAAATLIFPEKIGNDLARETLLTAREYAGGELRARGLKHPVLPRAEVYAEAVALARKIARLPRSRLITLKQQLTAHLYRPLDETYALELAMHDQTFVGRTETLERIQSKFIEAGAEARSGREPAAQNEPVNVAEKDVLPLIKGTLRKLLAQELHLQESDIDEHAQFVNLGMDSISGVTWIRKINEEYRTAIEATKVYSYPTLGQLSRYVKEEAEKQGTLPKTLPVVAESAPAVLPASSAPRAVISQMEHTRERGGAELRLAPAALRTLTSWRKRARSRLLGAGPSALPVHIAPSAPAAAQFQPIAVIGMAGQFPLANDLETFWRNIAQGKNCITEIPPKRWDLETYYAAGEPVAGKSYSKWLGALDEYDLFDPLFFNISPTEAESMDPQQRLFLQTCWHSIENAGYDPQSLSGSKCGVFVGCAHGDYHLLSREQQLSAHGFTGDAASILAARISYFLNLQGPCISIDTACSSSLVAIANACDSLISGASDLALAGGVYVMAGPEMHIKTSQSGMLSPDGRCFSFDQRANGFVPGEAVGVVMLKRLADAERDQDIIQGLVQGWGVNQDGKTNGITAPNPESQTRLQQAIYDKFQIDPASIQLIEAHGTGTKLGDPIEVEGLKTSFKKYTQKTDFCAIASIKSNIGHCLTAAGVAGFIKLILALKHKQLPPAVNFERLNEHIVLQDSPFYINDRLRPWDLRGATKRQAAISGFGFSGTNAHIVVGEYSPPVTTQRPVAGMPRQTSVAIPLSARSADQLKQKARDLLDFIRTAEQGADLEEIAYTLQVGRTAFRERLGLIATSLEQLSGKLQAYVEGARNIDDVYQGQGKNSKDALAFFSTDSDLQQTIDKWIAQRKLPKLLDLWVKGLELDWNKLYGAVKPRRVSLPAYPFAKERYWIDSPARTAATAVLHPLLHVNTSDLFQQSYCSTFGGEEFFLAGHQGRKVFSAMACLEMARAAVEHALPDERETSALELHNVVWVQPINISRSKQISIALLAQDHAQIDYEIYGAEDDGELVHCRGRAVFSRKQAPARIDLASVRAQIRPGDRQLLAQLHLPSFVAASHADYVLHPALMDSAVQAASGLLAEVSNAAAVALESIRIISSCPAEVFAWIRCSTGMKVDIDLCDSQGNVCVQMRRLSMRAASVEASEQLFYEECWQAQPPTVAAAPDNSQYIVFADEVLRRSIATAAAASPLARAVFVDRAAGSDIQSLLDNAPIEAGRPVALIYAWASGQKEAGIHALFALFKAVKNSARPIASVTLVGRYDSSDPETCWDYSWIGFERSLKLLLPSVQISLLLTDASACTPEQLLLASQLSGVTWYRNNQRYRLSLKPVELRLPTREPVLKQNGCYVVTGGCGALGFQFARYLAEKYHARLLLLGRSPLSAGIQQKLDTLKQAGAREVQYQAIDISDRAELTAWARTLPTNISGIIHAAGVESKQAFFDRSAADIEQVLLPKSTGTLLLDEVLGQQPLDFVCYFSSSAAVLGDLGSCDYAIANRFLMAYASARQQRGLGNGKTCVINWPLWQAGGMGSSDSDRAALYLKSSGQDALDVARGIDIWHDLLRAGPTQTLVLLGKRSQIQAFLNRQYVLEQKSRAASLPRAAAAFAGKGWKSQHEALALRERIGVDLKELIAARLKIPANKLDVTTNLADYGLDSIGLAALARQLTAFFHLEVTPALFFNYPTIEKLSDHFAQDHEPHFKAFYRRPEGEGREQTAPVVVASPASAQPVERKRLRRSTPSTTNTPEPIAIVGMSGRFPRANTADELWTLLAEGKSGISEIPASRWNWRDYFTAAGDSRNQIATNQGGFIDGVDEFDPLFFEISPREAELMDPGERLLLMEAYRAIEDARVSPASLRGSKVGVFVGMEEGQYGLLTDEQGVTTNGNAMVSSRLSYYLDFHGPTIATNTACSSGLVALHQACMSLRQRECHSALVAGVALTLSPKFYVKLSQAGMLSEDGQCFSFGRQANGIGVGEAVVVLMLKPLSAAIAAEDHIYGVIKASGVNFDGKTNGVTAPNGKMQAELIESIYTDHNIDTADVSHIVTHGTGTKLGDPVELDALIHAFNSLAKKRGTHGKKPASCAITSCKSNVGHTMAASGLVSVVGLLKGMQHQKIPATLYCEEENDYIRWQDSPFYLNKVTRDWNAAPGRPRLGGVSAFGRSGTNAHVVIEEYVPPLEVVHPVSITGQSPQVIIPLSAKTAEQLQQKARDLLAFIRTPDQDEQLIDLSALSYTLQMTREPMEQRLAFIVRSVDQLMEKLSAYLNGQTNIEDAYLGHAAQIDDGMKLLSQDDDMQELIDRWVARRKLSKLADLWVKGVKVEWSQLYGEVKPRRISLPVYPFAKDRYWVTGKGSKPSPDKRLAVARNLGSIEDIINQVDDNLIEPSQAVKLLNALV